MLPGWDDVSQENEIQIERVSGALTNCVFFVTKNTKKEKLRDNQAKNKKPLKVVLRVYGNGVDQLCDRQKELNFLEMLSTVKIGPKLLGIFKNGRFEEHLESVTLKSNDLRDPPISRHIAQRMSQLHNIINIFPPPQEEVKPEVWVNIDKWFPLALKTVFSETFICTEEQKKELEEFNFELLKKEVEDLKIKLFIDSPIVFAHNDTQYGNILRLTNGQLVVVDFEYAGYNYAAFDIANHFCEWMYDYRSSDPHKMNLSAYPNDDQQINFLQSYLDTEKYLTSDPTIDNANFSSPPSLTHDNSLQKLKSDVYAFTLASHVMWGLWGLVQSGQSQIDFDYLSYGLERLKHFRNLKNEVYEYLSFLNQESSSTLDQ
ncbi:kinase-like domain-containing protein [Glomus cerebriforme]|uniref:Kinase-like domain-containing protein n=1 Tax=Glomus cerebriforme TaxID=658196 RepID=A0A397T6Q8_9GLOM|nr:kinase-like domain-containing protein [Glomus cerebriforme]